MRRIMHRLGEQWTKSVMNGVPVRAPCEIVRIYLNDAFAGMGGLV